MFDSLSVSRSVVKPPNKKMWSDETGVKECQDRPTGPCWGTLLPQWRRGRRTRHRMRNTAFGMQLWESVQSSYSISPWLWKPPSLTERWSSRNLHFMPFPGVQVYVIQVIQSVVLWCKRVVNWSKTTADSHHESWTNTQLSDLYWLPYFVSSTKHVSSVPNCGTGMSCSG